jgi:hypothetical protein
MRSVGDRDTASGQLGTWIQHQISWGQGYSFRSVGTGYTTNDIRFILVARKSYSQCKHCGSPWFDPSTSYTIKSKGRQM